MHQDTYYKHQDTSSKQHPGYYGVSFILDNIIMLIGNIPLFNGRILMLIGVSWCLLELSLDFLKVSLCILKVSWYLITEKTSWCFNSYFDKQLYALKA